jgi:hypothetical protein
MYDVRGLTGVGSLLFEHELHELNELGTMREQLMIGDWVYNTHNRQNEQVQEIGSGLVMLDYNDLYEFDEIRPIHLTQQIMEKNFPDYETGYTIGWWPNDDSTFHVEWQEDLEGNQVILKHVMYVHELQHLLRMVKCNKEIEL